MQKFSSLVLFCFSLVCSAPLWCQIGFSDDFSDGNFTSNPTWFGDTALFQIDTNNRLQLADTINNRASLVTPSSAAQNASWEFYVSLDFDPSTSNFAKVYLISDSLDLSSDLHGYYVRVGGQSGTVDNVRLYRQDGSSDHLLINGLSGTVATTPEVKIKVTRSTVNQWELFLDLSGNSSNYQSQGSATDAQYDSSQYFGVYCQYTSTRSDKFFFDDFQVLESPIQDTVPPSLSGVVPLSNDTLLLTFNEKLEASTALNLSNFEVDLGIGAPSQVIFATVDSTSLYLLFSSPFANATNYELTTRNINDKAGNTLIEDRSPFFYFISIAPNFRDLVINEVYADPSPSNGLPSAEYIELFNASSTVFDLENWTLSDASGSATLSSQLLRPGDYLILCGSSAVSDFASYGLTQGVANFPTLNNSGDQLSLRDNLGTLVDHVAYTDEWYEDNTKSNGGYALEQKNPFTTCTGAINFSAASANIGGTPATQNSIFDTLPDTQAPSFVSASVIDPSRIQLEFDELLDSSSVLNANYLFSPAVSVTSVLNQAPNYQSVVLELTTPLDSGTLYTLTVSDIRDCFGNLIASGASKSIAISGVASYRDIVINELYPDENPSNGLPESEYIELLNASNQVFDLRDWSISDGTSTSTLSTQVLLPGEFLILCPQNTTNDFATFGLTQGQANFPSLNNTGDHITLKDHRGVLIDEVHYTNEWYQDNAKNDGGYALEQVNPYSSLPRVLNFRASTANIGGTPGATNSVFDTLPDTQAPSLIKVSVLASDSILLTFDETIDSLSVLTADYLFDPIVSVDQLFNQTPSYQTVLLVLSTPLDSGVFYTLTIDGLSDWSGNLLPSDASSPFLLPYQPINKEIIVNEVLFNPYSGGSDFVELFNRSKKILDLSFLRIANIVGDSVANEKTISDTTFTLSPKEYLVLTENKENILQNYPNAVGSRILEINDLPSYNDDEGGVVLTRLNQNLIDRFDYEDDFHFDLLNDDEGVSLERISSERPSNDPTNWHSASETVGFATPGYQNSQDFSQITFNGKVNLEPEMISPDNDGFQDVLSINYQFEAPGYVANVSIYDRRGRLIRNLVKNELLGSEGSFTWDGLSNENTKARVGVYVVLFEAFTTSGTQEVFKNVVTVASFLD